MIAAAQIQFAPENAENDPNNNTTHSKEDLANANIDYDLVPLTEAEIDAINMPAPDKSAINTELEGSGFTYYGYTMLLHSNTKLRFYFQKDNPDLNCSSIQLNKIEEYVTSVYTAKSYNDYFVYVELPSIPAYELNYSYKLNADGHSFGYYSALTYVKDVLTDDNSDSVLVNTVTAMYRYHEAAVHYFNNN